MLTAKKQLKKHLIRKATQSISKFPIAALGFNKSGDCVAKETNKPRFNRQGGGRHAEREIMRYAKKRGVVHIIICRIGKNMELLPIDPCDVCQKIADKLQIKISTIIWN